MNRTELVNILGSHGTLADRLTVGDADYSVYGVDLPDQKSSNAVLFDIPSDISTEFVEIVGPINLSVLTLFGIGRVLLHDRASGETSQHKLTVAESPVSICQRQIYAYQSLSGVVLLDTCTPPFEQKHEIEPDIATLPTALLVAHRGGCTASLST